MMKYTFFLLFFVLVTSCNNTNEIAIESFKVVDNIVEYDSLFSDKNEPMGVITGMEVVGNTLDTKLCFRFIVLFISNFRIKKSGIGNGFATSELR